LFEQLRTVEETIIRIGGRGSRMAQRHAEAADAQRLDRCVRGAVKLDLARLIRQAGRGRLHGVKAETAIGQPLGNEIHHRSWGLLLGQGRATGGLRGMAAW